MVYSTMDRTRGPDPPFNIIIGTRWALGGGPLGPVLCRGPNMILQNIVVK